MRARVVITVVAALVLIASAVPAATVAKGSHHVSTATVSPNGTSCPSANTQPTIPPLGTPAITPDNVHDTAPATAPIIAGNSTCPVTGSDAETNIARGKALAKPEPLNSPSLITPAH